MFIDPFKHLYYVVWRLDAWKHNLRQVKIHQYADALTLVRYSS